jgi:hypothetical protein
MRITNNMVTNTVLAELQQLDSQQSTLQAEVSSGLAVTQPSDDPGVFGQVIQEEGQSNQLAQFNQNATQALDTANSSYAGITSLTQIYDRATQLATLGSGTLGASANSGYADELNQLIQQAVTVANSQSAIISMAGRPPTRPPSRRRPTPAATSRRSATSATASRLPSRCPPAVPSPPRPPGPRIPASPTSSTT